MKKYLLLFLFFCSQAFSMEGLDLKTFREKITTSDLAKKLDAYTQQYKRKIRISNEENWSNLQNEYAARVKKTRISIRIDGKILDINQDPGSFIESIFRKINAMNSTTLVDKKYVEEKYVKAYYAALKKRLLIISLDDTEFRKYIIRRIIDGVENGEEFFHDLGNPSIYHTGFIDAYIIGIASFPTKLETENAEAAQVQKQWAVAKKIERIAELAEGAGHDLGDAIYPFEKQFRNNDKYVQWLYQQDYRKLAAVVAAFNAAHPDIPVDEQDLKLMETYVKPEEEWQTAKVRAAQRAIKSWRDNSIDFYITNEISIEDILDCLSDIDTELAKLIDEGIEIDAAEALSLGKRFKRAISKANIDYLEKKLALGIDETFDFISKTNMVPGSHLLTPPVAEQDPLAAIEIVMIEQNP